MVDVTAERFEELVADALDVIPPESVRRSRTSRGRRRLADVGAAGGPNPAPCSASARGSRSTASLLDRGRGRDARPDHHLPGSDQRTRDRRRRPRGDGAHDRPARGRSLLRAGDAWVAKPGGPEAPQGRPSTIVTMRAGYWRSWGRTQRCEPAVVETPASELEVRGRSRGPRRWPDRQGRGQRPLVHRHRLHRRADADPGCPQPVVWSTRGAARDRRGWDHHPAPQRGARAPGSRSDPRGHRPPELRRRDRAATHGTGATFGGLATFVRGLQMITADGEQLRCSADEEPEVFHAALSGSARVASSPW